MKRIAIISDIHGNLPALKAVIQDIEANNVDAIICLGDISNLGPCPKEVMDIVKGLECRCILGNHEEAMLQPDKADAYNIKGEMLQETLRWSLTKLDEDDIKFIKSLQRTLEVPIHNDQNILFYHGSPKSSIDSILPTSSTEEIDGYLNVNEKLKIAIGGHTHFQMLRKHKDIIIVNPGSVGCSFLNPFVNPPFPSYLLNAEYAIIDLKDDNISVELKSINFDYSEFKDLILRSDLPLKPWWLEEFERIEKKKIIANSTSSISKEVNRLSVDKQYEYLEQLRDYIYKDVVLADTKAGFALTIVTVALGAALTLDKSGNILWFIGVIFSVLAIFCSMLTILPRSYVTHAMINDENHWVHLGDNWKREIYRRYKDVTSVIIENFWQKTSKGTTNSIKLLLESGSSEKLVSSLSEGMQRAFLAMNLKYLWVGKALLFGFTAICLIGLSLLTSVDKKKNLSQTKNQVMKKNILIDTMLSGKTNIDSSMLNGKEKIDTMTPIKEKETKDNIKRVTPNE